MQSDEDDEPCDGILRVSESIVADARFDADAGSDILAVLRSKGGFCDCEVLFNVAKESSLAAKCWRRIAAETDRSRTGQNTQS